MKIYRISPTQLTIRRVIKGRIRLTLKRERS